MAFIGGIFVGTIIGYAIASLCYISREFRDDDIEMDIEEDNKE